VGSARGGANRAAGEAGAGGNAASVTQQSQLNSTTHADVLGTANHAAYLHDASHTARVAKWCACCLQVSLMQQIERELPYFSCSSSGNAAEDATAGSGASAAAAVPPARELLSSFIERCKVTRKGHRKLWGECTRLLRWFVYYFHSLDSSAVARCGASALVACQALATPFSQLKSFQCLCTAF
jgi:hypothetical protein